MSEVPSGLPDAEAALLSSDAIDRALATLPADLRIAVILRDVGVAADETDPVAGEVGAFA